MLILNPKCNVAMQVEADPQARDAESRVAAVNALANAAQELFPLADTKPHEDIPLHGCLAGTCREAAKALRILVLSPLLAATNDYATDDRGDVGSWVRAAAMSALTRALLLWAGHARHGPDMMTSLQPREDARAVISILAPAGDKCSLHTELDALEDTSARGDGKDGVKGMEGASTVDGIEKIEQGSAEGTPSRPASIEGPRTPQMAFTDVDEDWLWGGCDDISADVARALLKQAAERLDRLRKVKPPF
jgi:hypothetical protein